MSLKVKKIIRNENETLINDSFEVTNVMNNYFVNVVENTTGKKTPESACDESGNISQATLTEIIDTYQDHESIKTIKSSAPKGNETFRFQHATANDEVKIIKTLDKNTSIGIDDVPPKLIILASHVISGPLSDFINSTLIGESIFPSVEKAACVTPAFKKSDRLNKENYRPISVLNTVSKVLERFLANQMIPYLNNIFSVFLSAYRKHYSCQHVLLRMTEKWRNCLDESKQ